MKIIHIILFIALTYSCDTKVNSSGYPRSVKGYDMVYKHEYNKKGKLKKTLVVNTFANPSYNKVNDYEEIYIYDDSDSLIKIERYKHLSHKNEKELSSEVFILGDTLRKEFRYAEYPTDTFSWSYEKYNAKGDAIESYMKMRAFDNQGRPTVEGYRYIREYDTTRNIITSTRMSLSNIVEDIYVTTLKEYTLGDTLVADRFNKRNSCASTQKKYITDKFDITTHIDYENNTVDTLFSVLGKEVRLIRISPIEKTEVVSEYDSLGNVTKMEERVYEIIK